MTKTKRIKAAERRAGVELLLAETVPQVGNQGEIVRVKSGFARNYLLPQGLATVATEENKRMLARHKEQQAKAAAERRQKLKQLADAVSKYSVTLEANATPEGHLYGSILAKDISKALIAAGYAVQPDHIKLEGPLKELGMYTVKLQFDADVENTVKVWVVPAAAH